MIMTMLIIISDLFIVESPPHHVGQHQDNTRSSEKTVVIGTTPWATQLLDSRVPPPRHLRPEVMLQFLSQANGTLLTE